MLQTIALIIVKSRLNNTFFLKINKKNVKTIGEGKVKRLIPRVKMDLKKLVFR